MAAASDAFSFDLWEVVLMQGGQVCEAGCGL